jgi:hypothetical protein
LTKQCCFRFTGGVERRSFQGYIETGANCFVRLEAEEARGRRSGIGRWFHTHPQDSTIGQRRKLFDDVVVFLLHSANIDGDAVVFQRQRAESWHQPGRGRRLWRCRSGRYFDGRRRHQRHCVARRCAALARH